MSSTTRHAFGKRVRSLRTESGFSLRKFALTIGVDKSFLVDIEYGRVSPTLDTIERIASGLDMDLASLFWGVGTVGPIEYDGSARAEAERSAVRQSEAPSGRERTPSALEKGIADETRDGAARHVAERRP